MTLSQTTLRNAAIAACIALPVFAFAGGTHDQGPGRSHGHDHEHKHTPPDVHAHGAELAIPNTREGVIMEIQEQHATLAVAVEAKDAHSAHDAEARLQRLLKALPGTAGELDSEKQARLAGLSRNLARAYDGVHRAADKGTWDRAATEFAKADGGLKLLAPLAAP